jgi:acetyl esterase
MRDILGSYGIGFERRSTTMAENPFERMAQAMLENPPQTVHDMRKMLDQMVPMLNADLPVVGAFHPAVPVREVSGTRVTADVVVPRGKGPHPVLVYLHGGGWVGGSPASHRKLGYRFAEAGFLVFNVDYRLAPEHPFPAPFEDSVDAIRFAARAARTYGGDPARLAVGGDSAGGNLTAAAVAALAGEEGAPRVGAVLLIYGVFDFAMISRTGSAAGEVAERMMELMIGSYLGRERGDALLRDPRASPIHAAAKLPPAYVLCGTADNLLEQAHAITEQLAAAGIPHEKEIVADMPHGFVQIELFPQARASIDRMAEFLRRHLK